MDNLLANGSAPRPFHAYNPPVGCLAGKQISTRVLARGGTLSIHKQQQQKRRNAKKQAPEIGRWI
jgi:hypothetical protein